MLILYTFSEPDNEQPSASIDEQPNIGGISNTEINEAKIV